MTFPEASQPCALERLRIEGVSQSYNGVRILKDVDIEVRGGEVVGLVGPNGAGKTTLLNVISGFIPVDSGRILLNGNDLKGLPPHHVAKLGIGRLFQDIRLFPRLNALDNVLIAYPHQRGENPLYAVGARAQVEAAERSNQVAVSETLRSLGIKVGDVPAEVLSYGEQKLLAIARLLALGARMLLLDEMAAGVSDAVRPQLARALRHAVSGGCGVLLSEHDLPFLAEVCTRVCILEGGRVVADDSPTPVLKGDLLRRVLYGV